MMPAHNRDEAIEECARELKTLSPQGVDAALDGMQWVWDSYMDDEMSTE